MFEEFVSCKTVFLKRIKRHNDAIVAPISDGGRGRNNHKRKDNSGIRDLELRMDKMVPIFTPQGSQIGIYHVFMEVSHMTGYDDNINISPK